MNIENCMQPPLNTHGMNMNERWKLQHFLKHRQEMCVFPKRHVIKCEMFVNDKSLVRI